MVNKIFIFGSVGSGKSTLAKKLSDSTNIPFYTLGNFKYIKYPNEKYPEKIRNKKLNEVAKRKKWIIEGVYFDNWILPAFKKVDLVIIIDLNKSKLYFQIITRALSSVFLGNFMHIKTIFRALRNALKYKQDGITHYKDLVQKYRKNYVILKTRKEINTFLENFL